MFQHHKSAPHSFVILAIAGLLLAALPLFGAEGEPEWYYYNAKKEKVPLELDESALAVFDFEPGLGRDVAADLAAAGLRGFEHRPFEPGWSFFERADASAPPRLASASDRSGIEGLIRSIAHRQDNVYFLAPVFELEGGARAWVPPDVLVRFHDDVSPSLAKLLLRAEGGTSCEDDWGGMKNAYTVNPHTLSGFEALALANRLAELPEVKWAEPGLIVSAEPSCSPLSPNPPIDPDYSQSWGLEQFNDIDLDAQGAWSVCAGSPTIKLAIIDDGVESTHEDLTVVQSADCTNVTGLWSCGSGQACVPGGDPVSSLDNHGTTVAGVAAALANGIQSKGSTGIAPNVGLVSIRTQASNSVDPRRLVNALVWAEANGVRVTNFSWYSQSTPASNAACVADKYFETRSAGMVHFSSAGNGDVQNVWWPASVSSVNAISAVDTNGDRWVSTPGSFGSNYGLQIQYSAPGQSIFTTDRMGSQGYSDPANYASVNGTSYAAPFAAGVAALVLSIAPEFSADAVETILCKSAVDLGIPGKDLSYGCGLINASAALTLTQSTLFIDGFEAGSYQWWSGAIP